ncbi:MAG: cytochrome c oxidase assembly protein [Hyphomicrobiaceae bacterium]|jgi:cytochrome c oxidase assembly protein subunit 11|nr:cytochrome c oxidase assembly protein [Hyphomicrobiaceae bacterium]
MKIGKDNAVALSCVAAVVFMTGAAFAAVPLYKLYCQVTGYGGTTQKAIEPSHVMLDRKITVRFDANVTPGMKWKFEPMQRTMDVKLGENALAFYKATNISDHAITGTAAFNVAPDVGGIHFSKVQCFCFEEQTLAPGESVEMPVSFFVSPALASDPDAAHLSSLTLSYTFYPVDKPKDAVAAKQSGEPGKGS